MAPAQPVLHRECRMTLCPKPWSSASARGWRDCFQRRSSNSHCRLLARYALARPNARSSHTAPTPQGAGTAVIAATVLISSGFLLSFPGAFAATAPLLAATLFIATIGAIDDVRPGFPVDAPFAGADRRGRHSAMGLSRDGADCAVPAARSRARDPAVGNAVVCRSRQLHRQYRLDDDDRMFPITAALVAFGLFGAISSAQRDRRRRASRRVPSVCPIR